MKIGRLEITEVCKEYARNFFIAILIGSGVLSLIYTIGCSIYDSELKREITLNPFFHKNLFFMYVVLLIHVVLISAIISFNFKILDIPKETIPNQIGIEDLK